MAETSKPWSGQVTGDAGPYSDDDWSDIWRKLFCTDRTTQGVIPGYVNELACTSPGANTLRVATGAALVDGKFYESTANVDVTIPTPVTSTRIDRVVLRKSWAAQTVRVTRIAGAEGGAAPAVTQNDGTTWDLYLCQVSITTLGAMTITDERQFLRTPAILALRRQGGSATVWSTAGTTDYRPAASKIQCGAVAVGTGATATVTFPEAFAYAPVVVVSPFDTGSGSPTLHADSISASQVAIYNGGQDGTAIWVAIGP